MPVKNFSWLQKNDDRESGIAIIWESRLGKMPGFLTSLDDVLREQSLGPGRRIVTEPVRASKVLDGYTPRKLIEEHAHYIIIGVAGKKAILVEEEIMEAHSYLRKFKKIKEPNFIHVSHTMSDGELFVPRNVYSQNSATSEYLNGLASKIMKQVRPDNI